MNELQIFDNPEFGEIRAVEIDGEPWFVAVDVCRTLELEDAGRATSRLDEDELTRIKIVSGGQNREVIAVNEPGLYSLVLGSRKPEAKAFKRWITHEVLPSIRRTGSYTAPQRIPAVSPGGLARLIHETRAVMADMGSSSRDIGQMVQSVFQTWGIPVPVSLHKQISGQLSLFE